MIVSLRNASAYRSGRPVLSGIDLTLCAGDRIFVSGENGAGKSTLLALLAARLHPFGSEGRRDYAWDHLQGEDFRSSRKYIAYVSREEQHRAQNIHAGSTLREFLIAHSDGADFLYREIRDEDRDRVQHLLSAWNTDHLSDRKLRTLSFGEMRLALMLRAMSFARRLYVFDEPFTSLSPQVLERVIDALKTISQQSALIMTGHDDERVARLQFTGVLHIAAGRVHERRKSGISFSFQKSADGAALQRSSGETLIRCRGANFYHDFNRIFTDLSFTLSTGARIVLTGENGSGKSTLLRIMHGDFYPEFGSGSLEFVGPLAHSHKAELWNRVQIVAASQFTYFPSYMSVLNVLATRLSGSLYEYPEQLGAEALRVAEDFSVANFLSRRFAELSEGEKTRVLMTRAFLLPAPVYLIDEGFVALSETNFKAALEHLTGLASEAAVVIAANERIGAVAHGLKTTVTRWHIADGRLTTLV
ncbi:MAG: ATP-binding cassette domain-containing protein [Leptospiraceae bacterium]|nr:ATP-binding cassette domain-containing protein [Leptospiraceae bacterium]